jgi:hypothetical protein
MFSGNPEEHPRKSGTATGGIAGPVHCVLASV